MTQATPTRLLQVMLFKETENLQEFGRAIWAALEEVGAFYNAGGLASERQRLLFDPNRPGDPLRPDLPEVESMAGGHQSDLWRSLKSHHPRNHDQHRMRDVVRDALGPRVAGAQLLILTDQPIQPPEDWRYILWDGVGRDVVVSTAAMDPRYWVPRGRNRAAHVKHRARSATLNGTGTQLGLERCDNPDCFLYSFVDSVEVLDSMLVLGPEHKQDILSDRGFSWPAGDPAEVQQIVLHPAAGPEALKNA